MGTVAWSVSISAVWCRASAGVQTKAAGRPFPELLDEVRTGPPWWSPLRPVDAVANLPEMFVHPEDVRRGAPGWEPRELPAADEEKLWSLVRRMAVRSYRKAPVRVVLATPDGKRAVVGAKSGGEVTLTAKPSELLLHAFGRDEVRLETTGDPEAVRNGRESGKPTTTFEGLPPGAAMIHAARAAAGSR